MRIGLLTDGGYPYATGESGLWCDRLVRGLAQHEFDLFALSRSAEQEAQGWVQLPTQVGRVRTAPLWTADENTLGTRASKGLLARMVTGGGARSYGRRERQRFEAHFAALAASVCAAGAVGGEDEAPGAGAGAPGGEGRTAAADGQFTDGLYGLAELAREHGGLIAALRSETAVRLLEAACRAPGTGRIVQTATVPDLLAFARELARVLRPLSLDWYDEEGLGAVDLCHATGGGAVALPGLLAKRFSGVPLLVTEHGAQLRAHYLAATGAPLNAPVRALLACFHRRLATEVYRQAAIVTPGNAHARRWQERCGAERGKLRTVYPGMASDRFTALGESGDSGPGGTLVWVGRIEPAKDLIALLHAFAEVRKAEPGARLRIIGAPAPGPEGATYLAHCRALAAQLFPDEAPDAHAVGDNPVSFEEIGGAEVADLPDAYAAGGVVVLSSVVEGFPVGLVEAMFCGRATVSTDVGAVVEVIGGTGLVVPPRNPRALADACLALLRDPERRARLGAAARARALELFTVEQNIAAFRGIYLELILRAPVRREAEAVDADGEPRPFAMPPEAHVLGPWTASVPAPAATADRKPSWAAGSRAVCAGAPGAGGGDA
ncbi:glycosyltransferase [Streptomyces gelaticus]|uniref:glycosyltransferase n=1 Tax=Streptomyces gelaticus TaxID=285446 RepID=UPI00167288D7|nr:glycosyltransferase [Streptomyces gelaticus]